MGGVYYFSYEKNQPVLHNIKLSIPPKKTTALIGPSGAGKSTLINLLLRLYDPDSGYITINGQDIKKTSFQSLRQHIAYVGQDTFLFEGSVKYNISLGAPNASEEEIIKAAKAAHAHEFIMRLPQAYDNLIGENGNLLSGGQKQRLTIARAILKKAEILILDEATSALDSESEILIQEAIQKLTADKTTILITHRLNRLAKVDNIIVLNQGTIVETGTEKTLLAKKEGLYRKLYKLHYQDKDL